MRWHEYVIALGGLDDPPEPLWEAAIASALGKQSMYVLGVGFDPRALVGLQQFLALNHATPPLVGLIELPPPSAASGPSTRALAADNQAAFAKLVANIEVRTIEHRESHSHSNAGPRIARQVTDRAFTDGIGHLIIDISSLPSNLYFPIIAGALASDERRIEGFPTQVQIVACENPAVDAAVIELGVTDAGSVGGFRGRFASESEPRGTVIWAPVVRERSRDSLIAIHDRIAPDDVFPVLPFPSRNPRRADDLLIELQVELLDIFRVEPANIIYADERNPFDLYRTLSRLQKNLSLTLTDFDSTTLVLSTPASKVLSLGVLLAAYEHDLPIISAPPAGYEFDGVDLSELASGHQVTCAWLTGLPESLAAESGRDVSTRDAVSSLQTSSEISDRFSSPTLSPIGNDNG